MPGRWAKNRLAREIAEVNFQGVINTVCALVPVFAARRSGHIVIISSLAAEAPVPLAPSYAASKAGVAAYARNLRLLLHDSGVGVTLALPGFVDTAMSRDLPGPKPGLMSADAAARHIAAAIAAKRAEIAFPLRMRLLVAAARSAPDFIIRRVLSHWQGRPQ